MSNQLQEAVTQRDPVLSVETVAARLGVHVATVRAEITRGRLSAFRVGKLIRVRESALVAYMSADDTAPAAS